MSHAPLPRAGGDLGATPPPRPIVDKVHADLSTVLRAPDVQQRMNDMVIDVAPTSPEAFSEFIRSETNRWAKVVKDAGIAQQ